MTLLDIGYYSTFILLQVSDILLHLSLKIIWLTLHVKSFYNTRNSVTKYDPLWYLHLQLPTLWTNTFFGLKCYATRSNLLHPLQYQKLHRIMKCTDASHSGSHAAVPGSILGEVDDICMQWPLDYCGIGMKGFLTVRCFQIIPTAVQFI